MTTTSSASPPATARLDRLERAIDAQKAFLHRVPDPDTRRRAETNLLVLIEMRDTAARAHPGALAHVAQETGMTI